MRNPNNPIKNLDDTPKSREEIEKMIDNMMKTNEEGYPETDNKNLKTA